MGFKDISVGIIGDKDFSFKDSDAKAYLIVNTASLWGFTPQLGELEELSNKYKDMGLKVIGFPCNQFGGQDPWDNLKIREFAVNNYDVTFPMALKCDVNGDDANEVYKHIKSFGNEFSEDIQWNFTKFLLDSNGTPIKRFEGDVKPMDIGPDVEALLNK